MSEMYKVKDMCQRWDMQGFFDLCNSTDSVFMTVEFADDDLGIEAEAVFSGRLVKEPLEGKMQFLCHYQTDRVLIGMKCFLAKFTAKMIRCDLFITNSQQIELSAAAYDKIFQTQHYDRGFKTASITVFEFANVKPAIEANEETALHVLNQISHFINTSTIRTRSN